MYGPFRSFFFFLFGSFATSCSASSIFTCINLRLNKTHRSCTNKIWNQHSVGFFNASWVLINFFSSSMLGMTWTKTMQREMFCISRKRECIGLTLCHRMSQGPGFFLPTSPFFAFSSSHDCVQVTLKHTRWGGQKCEQPNLEPKTGIQIQNVNNPMLLWSATNVGPSEHSKSALTFSIFGIRWRTQRVNASFHELFVERSWTTLDQANVLFCTYSKNRTGFEVWRRLNKNHRLDPSHSWTPALFTQHCRCAEFFGGSPSPDAATRQRPHEILLVPDQFGGTCLVNWFFICRMPFWTQIDLSLSPKAPKAQTSPVSDVVWALLPALRQPSPWQSYLKIHTWDVLKPTSSQVTSQA